MDKISSSKFGARRTSEQLPPYASSSKSVSWRKTSDVGLEEQNGPLGLTTVYMPLQDTVAHVIFVHGLGGGSRKTWIKNADPSLFWLKEWLPQDTDFRDVTIHTFGYDSSWTKGSVLDVSDFAKSLLEWIVDCPEIALDTGVRRLRSMTAS